MGSLSLALLGCLVLWAAWFVQAALSARLSRHLARKIAMTPPPEEARFRPPVTVIIPITGVEEDAPSLVEALRSQCYPDLRVVFAVTTTDDPAYDAVKAAIEQQSNLRAQVMVTGESPPTRSQKVHKSLTVVRRLEPAARDDEVWVFADADAVPNPHWLACLVGPLHRSDCMVTTGYRWLVPYPKPGRARASLWALLAAVLNNSVATLQAHKKTVQAWGGSMALTVGAARRGGLAELWRGALADDYAVTQLAARLGRPVRFAPRCLVPSPVAYGLRELVEFVRRQYLITRIHAPWIYWLALALTTLYVTATLVGWGYLTQQLLTRPGSGLWLWPVPFMAAVFLANQVRASARRRSVQGLFGPDTLRRLEGVFLLDRWCTPLWMALHAALVLSAIAGRTIRWRGVVYRLHGPQRIERLNPAA